MFTKSDDHQFEIEDKLFDQNKLKLKEKYTYLEKKLLQLSKNFLSYKEIKYNDDIVNTLKELYCLKKIDKVETEVEKKEDTSLWQKIWNRIAVAFNPKKKRNKKYLGLDGKIYFESDFRHWQQGYPLLILLRKKIKEGKFDPEW